MNLGVKYVYSSVGILVEICIEVKEISGNAWNCTESSSSSFKLCFS